MIFSFPPNALLQARTYEAPNLLALIPPLVLLHYGFSSLNLPPCGILLSYFILEHLADSFCGWGKHSDMDS